MGKFLISVVCSSDTYPQLIPQELLARHGVDRTRMEDARAMRPVNDEILNRAADALQASAPMTRDGLSRYVNRQRLISERRIRRLRRYDPRSAAAGLRPIDHFLVSARLLLRR